MRDECARLQAEANAVTARRDAELASIDVERTHAKKAVAAAKKLFDSRQVKSFDVINILTS